MSRGSQPYRDVVGPTVAVLGIYALWFPYETWGQRSVIMLMLVRALLAELRLWKPAVKLWETGWPFVRRTDEESA